MELPKLPSPQDPAKALAAQEQQLQERLALSVATRAFVACVYQVGEQRNTWGGRFVYRAERSFVTMAAAQAFVERDRKMGSAWRIRELPACAFVGAEESFVVADSEVSPRVPLHAHAYDARCRPYLAPIRNAFKQFVGTRLRLLAPTHQVTEAQLFREWISETFGGRYTLSWTPITRENRFDLSAIKTIIETHRDSLRSSPFWGLVHEDSKLGSIIRQLHPRSPLAHDGLQVGDVITHVNNLTNQLSEQSLSAGIATARPGDVVAVAVQREAVLELRVQLKSFEDAFKNGETYLA